MRIALFRDLPEEQFRSMEVYADELVAGLSRAGTGLVIEEVTEKTPRITGAEPFRVLDRFGRVYAKFVRYPARARARQGDVNHIVDQSYAHLVHQLDPARTVVTCHDLVPLEVEHEVVPSSKAWHPGIWLARYAYSGLIQAACVIADSEATKRSVEKYLRYQGRIEVIPLGVSPFFTPMRPEDALAAVRDRGLNNRRPFLLHVGSTSEYKNIGGLLRVFRILTRDFGIDLWLVKVGERLTPAQSRLAAELSVADRVLDLGSVSLPELRALYALAAAVMFPSHWEGFGLPVLEAMACGTPVIVSTAPSLLEITGGAALAAAANDFLELGNAARHVLTDDALREKLCAAGLNRSRGFTWDRTAKMVLSIYHDLYDTVSQTSGDRAGKMTA